MNVERIEALAEVMDRAQASVVKVYPKVYHATPFHMLPAPLNTGGPEELEAYPVGEGLFFSMSKWKAVGECGTTCCLAGWAVQLYGDPNSDGGYVSYGRDLLGLDDEQAEALFLPKYCFRAENYPPSKVARTLRHLAKTGIVDWNV